MTDKICIFVATSGHSGVDRYVKNLAPELVRQGVAVDILKVRNHGPYFEATIPGLNIIDLKAKSVYASLPEVVNYLKREKPKALLSDKDRVNRTALIAQKLSGVKVKVFVRSGTTVSIDLQHRNWLDRQLQKLSMGKLYRLADGVIIPSQEAAKDFAAFTGFPYERIQVLPLPLLPKSFTTQRPEHIWFKEDSPPVILGVGELCERKDFATLLRAFALVREKKNCRLVILGRGKQKEKLENLAKSLNIDDDVDFLGFQNNVYDFMRYSQVFAFSSKWEGFGAVLTEALACGTPVVSTSCPSGPRELITKRNLGSLVEIGNAEELAKELLYWLEQDKEIAAKERIKAVEKYQIDIAGTFYKKLLLGEK